MKILKRMTTLALITLFASGSMACGSDEDDPGGEENQQPTNQQPTNQQPGDVEEIPGQLMMSDLERDLDPDVDDATLLELTADNRAFAFSLFHALRDDDATDENLFLSPHSISTALAMMHGGAKENTYDQMSEVLHFHLGEDLHPAFNRLDLELASRSEVATDDDEDPFVLDLVNQSWGHEDFDFTDDFLDLLAVNYGAGMSLVDFVANHDEIREEINAWVEAQTNDRIQDLLPPGSLKTTTRSVMVNAIYFYGAWAQPFQESSTQDRPFTRLDGSTVDVPQMFEDRSVMAALDSSADTVAISIPYVGEEVSLVAMMPSDGEADFEAWEASLDAAKFDEVIASMSQGRVMLRFPRFESGGAVELKETLQALGMVDAFDECAADFSGITGHPPCIDFLSLYIDEIYHQTFVSVDEEGTEAAAATAVVGATPTSMPPTLDFDRPFIYAIYDHPTETILFLGRMVDPS